MTFKRNVIKQLAVCIMAILVIAMSGCEDLGEFEDVEDYYESLDDIILISGSTKKKKSYSIEDYFYSEESREDFLMVDGVYQGVEYSEYVYMAIPFNKDITVDTVALYLRAEEDVTVHMNIFVTEDIPSNWKPLASLENGDSDSQDETDKVTDAVVDNETGDVTEEAVIEPYAETTEETTEKATEGESETEEDEEYDDPDPDTRVGSVSVSLKKGLWQAFMLETFIVDGKGEASIEVEDGQYILIQFRNNSGICVFNEEKNIFIDPQTGVEIKSAKITMTNLLIRALDINDETDIQEEEV